MAFRLSTKAKLQIVAAVIAPMAMFGGYDPYHILSVWKRPNKKMMIRDVNESNPVHNNHQTKSHHTAVGSANYAVMSQAVTNPPVTNASRGILDILSHQSPSVSVGGQPVSNQLFTTS